MQASPVWATPAKEEWSVWCPECGAKPGKLCGYFKLGTSTWMCYRDVCQERKRRWRREDMLARSK